MLILKIAGLIILILLCLILILLAVLLFVPVRYRAEGKKYADLRGKARVSWLFGIFSVHAAYEDGLDVSVRIFGFPLRRRSETPEEEEQEEQESRQEDGKRREDEKEPDVHIASEEDVSEDFPYKSESVSQEEQKKEFRKDPGKRRKKRSLWKKILNRIAAMFRRFREAVKRLWKLWTGIEEKADKIKELISDKENQELLRLVFRQTKALFKHIFPRKARGKLRIGFEDPYTTGQAMALAGLLCPFYKDSLQVIPSFEEPVLEGELACSGRIRLAALLMIAGRLMASRTFRQALKKLFALRG